MITGSAEVRAETVVLRFRLGAVPDKVEDRRAYEGNQVDEPETATLAYVVETADGYCQPGRKRAREISQPRMGIQPNTQPTRKEKSCHHQNSARVARPEKVA